MTELLNNENFVWGAMAILVLCISQLIKLPIKALTKATIKNESARSRVNTLIMLIPLALGVFGDWLFCTFYLGTAFSVVDGIKIGGTAITLYGMLEKSIKGAPSPETEAALELVEKVTEDKKVDKKDNDAVKAFLKKVK